ncbi:MAG: outer membrane beta-barrel protein [Parabacteroides sp.]|nr:outer membrane beta-barrel protein [Parabacteroides sp.]
MKKKVVLGMALMMMPMVSFAGGYLTNTNQHAAFLRSLSRGAAIDIDGALSNPAGLSFLPTDGFRVGLSIQSAFQTRDIDASFGTYAGFDPINKKPVVGEVPYQKYYKGKAAAPVIPSVFAAYKKGDWTISGFFAITGGGGKASFNDGLPMFESAAMAGIYQESLVKYMQTGGQSPIITPDMYTINSAMDGKQFIYSLQLGLSYKITDWLSAFAGGRMNYFSGNYDGYLNAKLKQNMGGAELMALALDCDQTGWGLTPVLGVDVKYGKFNFGAKYEFKTNLNIENDTKKLDYPESAESLVGAYKHGVNTPNDIPSMLSVAASYQFLPMLKASVEYHFFDDKKARMAGGKQKDLERGTHEYLLGLEWDVIKRLTISGGAQITDYGLSDKYQSDTSFSCDSYSLGLGAKVMLSEKMALNVGYMWTTYHDYTKKMDNYCGTGLPGQNVYSRTNKVFGVSLDYAF